MAGVPEGVGLQEKVAAFCVASVRDWTGAAAAMLAETPEIAGYSVATALLLGDADRVRAEVDRDPGLAAADPGPHGLPAFLKAIALTLRLLSD
jgi:hypothetical protein